MLCNTSCIVRWDSNMMLQKKRPTTHIVKEKILVETDSCEDMFDTLPF
jgi:hypothetical protein